MAAVARAPPPTASSPVDDLWRLLVGQDSPVVDGSAQDIMSGRSRPQHGLRGYVADALCAGLWVVVRQLARSRSCSSAALPGSAV